MKTLQEMTLEELAYDYFYATSHDIRDELRRRQAMLDAAEMTQQNHPRPIVISGAVRKAEELDALSREAYVAALRARVERLEADRDLLAADANSLAAALMDCAEFIQEQFVKASGFTSKKQIKEDLKNHALLKPAREAIAAHNAVIAAAREPK